MDNLQWLPGMQYAFILISNPDTYNAEHQTHIYHYREYFPRSSNPSLQDYFYPPKYGYYGAKQSPIMANRDYNYIRHTKPAMLVTTPNITYSQYLELRERFIFYDVSFATMDLSELTESPLYYEKKILEHRNLTLTSDTILPIIDHYIAMNRTYKINLDQLDELPDTWQRNPQITPEIIFENVQYDSEGYVISRGNMKIQGDPDTLRLNPNFYCFIKNPTLLHPSYTSSHFISNPPSSSHENSTLIIRSLTKDISNTHDFIIKPNKPDLIYQNIMSGTINRTHYYTIFTHFIRSDTLLQNVLPFDYRLFKKNKKAIYLYTHPDSVKYDIDRL